MSSCNFGSKTFTIANPAPGKSCNFGTKTFTIAAQGNFNWGLWMHWNDLITIPRSQPDGSIDWWNTQVGKKQSWIGCDGWLYPTNSDGSPKYTGDPTLAQQVTIVMNQISNAYIIGGIPILMWSPAQVHKDNSTMDQSLFYNTAFTNGTYDAYFTALANAMKADGREIHFRMFHEMNAGGYPGCGWGAPWDANYWLNSTESAKGNNGTKINTPATFKAAWLHIVNIFRAANATNVKFWFSVGNWPSSAYYPPASWGNYPLSAIYPGDSYVDVLGFEIYNGRTTAPYDDATHTYGSAYSAVQAIYKELCALSSAKPVVLAEVGCKDATDSTTAKPNWLTSVLNPTTLKSLFPRLTGLMYWDDESNAFDGTWSLRTTAADQTAAINAFKSAGFKNGI